MNLILIRKEFTNKSTIGELSIDGIFECYILEDVDRPGSPKIPKQTAIPRGQYRVVLDWSNRFQRTMPHILDVPNFEGIRIHAGNTDKDTEGCLLTGRTKRIDFVGESKLAFDALYVKMVEVKNREEEMRIEII